MSLDHLTKLYKQERDELQRQYNILKAQHDELFERKRLRDSQNLDLMAEVTLLNVILSAQADELKKARLALLKIGGSDDPARYIKVD